MICAAAMGCAKKVLLLRSEPYPDRRGNKREDLGRFYQDADRVSAEDGEINPRNISHGPSKLEKYEPFTGASLDCLQSLYPTAALL
jgi:hypothetical protein